MDGEEAFAFGEGDFGGGFGDGPVVPFTQADGVGGIGGGGEFEGLLEGLPLISRAISLSA